jgi:mannose-1-phosphate guanylyltransferase
MAGPNEVIYVGRHNDSGPTRRGALRSRETVMENVERVRTGGSASPSPPGWGIVLAGVDGAKERARARRLAATADPPSRETLVEQTLRRAAMVLAPDRILTAVVRAHERSYAPFLATLSSRCLLVQPEDRGSAPAVFYGLLRLLRLAPAEPVAILPADHYVADDGAFVAHVKAAFEIVLSRPDLLVLLGVPPDTDAAEDEWIEPADAIPGPWPWSLYRVRHLWKMPSQAIGKTLLRSRGCLWDSRVMVAHPSALLSLIRHAAPGLSEAFTLVESRLGTPWEDESVRRVYARLPSTEFSKHVVASSRPANLAVLPLTGAATRQALSA